MSDTDTLREDALAAEMTRRNLVDATERALKCLTGANVGLQRLSGLQYERYREATNALAALLRALKFGR